MRPSSTPEANDRRSESLRAQKAARLKLQPHRPTTTPAEALRGVFYESVTIRTGSLQLAISRGRSLPRIYGHKAAPSCATALCLGARP